MKSQESTYGIETLKTHVSAAHEIAIMVKEASRNGFGFSDLVYALPTINQMNIIAKNLEAAKLEIKDLQRDEIQEIADILAVSITNVLPTTEKYVLLISKTSKFIVRSFEDGRELFQEWQAVTGN